MTSCLAYETLISAPFYNCWLHVYSYGKYILNVKWTRLTRNTTQGLRPWVWASCHTSSSSICLLKWHVQCDIQNIATKHTTSTYLQVSVTQPDELTTVWVRGDGFECPATRSILTPTIVDKQKKTGLSYHSYSYYKHAMAHTFKLVVDYKKVSSAFLVLHFNWFHLFWEYSKQQ